MTLPEEREIGVKILIARRDRGLTQDELAAKCGIGRVTICNIERNRRNMTYRVLRAISEVLPEILSDV